MAALGAAAKFKEFIGFWTMAANVLLICRNVIIVNKYNMTVDGVKRCMCNKEIDACSTDWHL